MARNKVAIQDVYNTIDARSKENYHTHSEKQINRDEQYRKHSPDNKSQDRYADWATAREERDRYERAPATHGWRARTGVRVARSMVPPTGDGGSPAPIDRLILEFLQSRLQTTRQVSRVIVTDTSGHLELKVVEPE